MPSKNINIQKTIKKTTKKNDSSKSVFLINLAIRLDKILLFVCLVYFSYFFLFATQFGEVVLTKVNKGLYDSKIFIAQSIQVLTDDTPIVVFINDREKKPETLSKLSFDEISALGIVRLPYGFQIQDEYRGIKFVRSPKKSYSATQIKLLKYFIDHTPTKLLNPGPDAFVIFESEEIDYEDFTILNPSTLAFSSGSYVFLTDISFEGTDSSLKTIDESMQTFFHELTHIAQFNYELQYLTDEQIYDIALKGVDWTELLKKSDLTKGFQGITEWKYSYENSEYYLENPESVNTTKYGRTSIYEDIAETIAGTITSQIYTLSDNRVKWALFFLEESYDFMIMGMIPHNELFVPVRQEKPRLNFEKEAEYKANYNITDRQYFIVEEEFMIKNITDYFTENLPKRGFNGSFQYTKDKNDVEKYLGEYKNQYRSIYIELESFDKAKGYSVKPKGTIINIINGYDFSQY